MDDDVAGFDQRRAARRAGDRGLREAEIAGGDGQDLLESVGGVMAVCTLRRCDDRHPGIRMCARGSPLPSPPLKGEGAGWDYGHVSEAAEQLGGRGALLFGELLELLGVEDEAASGGGVGEDGAARGRLGRWMRTVRPATRRSRSPRSRRGTGQRLAERGDDDDARPACLAMIASIVWRSSR